MNMIFDFYIPEEYRGRKVEIPKLSENEENFVLNIPSNACYFFVQPYDPEKVDDQPDLPLFSINYFTSKGDIIKYVQEYYNEISSLEGRLELIFERV